MTSKIWYLVNFIIAIIAVITFVILTIMKFSIGLYWFAVLYMVLTSAEGLLAWRYLKTYFELKEIENIR